MTTFMRKLVLVFFNRLKSVSCVGRRSWFLETLLRFIFADKAPTINILCPLYPLLWSINSFNLRLSLFGQTSVMTVINHLFDRVRHWEILLLRPNALQIQFALSPWKRFRRWSNNSFKRKRVNLPVFDLIVVIFGHSF